MDDSRPTVLLQEKASTLFLAFGNLSHRLVLAYTLSVMQDGHCELEAAGIPRRLNITNHSILGEFTVLPVKVCYSETRRSTGYWVG